MEFEKGKEVYESDDSEEEGEEDKLKDVENPSVVDTESEKWKGKEQY